VLFPRPKPLLRCLLALLLLVLSNACVPWPGPTGTPLAPKPLIPRWTIYDQDPDHLWNRMFRQFYGRTSGDGTEYGSHSLDPLLWFETTYLLEEESTQRALALLDEFTSTGGEELIVDPMRRALLQRDLWAVFDWTTLRQDTFPEERREFQRRLAEVIGRLALPQEEILALPDNLAAAADAGMFPAAFQPDRPEVPFLPPGLLDPEGGWILIGRDGGPAATSHTVSFPFFGRSAFLVFLRAPGGRQASPAFLERLNNERGSPSLASTNLTGLEVALVRRAVLIDDHGRLILSPLVESVQLRHYAPLQQFYEFQLDRIAFFEEPAGGLQPVEEEFALFFAHGIDPFESGFGGRSSPPESCRSCHGGEAYGVQSILSYSRFRFDSPDGEAPYLTPTTVQEEAMSVISWKMQDQTWEILRSFWRGSG